MRAILAHKTLFRKTALTGFLISIASIILFIAYSKSMLQGPEDYWTREATDYFTRIEHEAVHFMGQQAVVAEGILRNKLSHDANISESLAACRDSLIKVGGGNPHLWLIDVSDYSKCYSVSDEKVSSSDIIDVIKGREIGLMSTIIDDDHYYISVRPFEISNNKKQSEWILVTALTGEYVFDALDWYDRISGYSFNIDDAGIISRDDESHTIISVPLHSNEGVEIGRAHIKTIYQSFADKYLWGWQLALLSLLPILSVILFIYVIYRYFSSFSDHSVALARLLRSDRPGVEIFRRDQHVMEKYMPELAELFSLAGESAAEKLYFKKSYEQIGMTLEVIDDRGFENKSIGDILEFILKGMPDCGGVIFANAQSSEPSLILGKYNVGDDIINILEKTPKGQGFLKIAAKQPSRISLKDIQGIPPESDLGELFSKYKSVYFIPLRLKGRLIGILLLLSFESEREIQFFASISEMFIELISVLTFGVLLEKDKHLRAEGTRILQETSQAISSTLDLSSVLRIVAHRLADYTSATYCMILLNDISGEAIEVASFFSKRREGVIPPSLNRLNLVEYPGLARTITANRATVLERQDIEDLSDEEIAFFNGESIESLTVLPIAHSAKFIGSIILGEERSGARGSMGGDKLTIIQAIASQAASAIENARLYGFIKQQVDQLTASYNVSAIINSEINIDHMLSRVLDATGEYLDFDYSIIFAVNSEKGRLRALAYRGFTPEPGIDTVKDFNNNSISGLAASIGEAVIVDDTRLDSNLKSSFPGALSELAVPIKISDNVVGVFCVGKENKNSFSNLDEEFLQSLAAQIAVAMDKAELFEKEKERAKRLKIIYEFSRQTSKTLNVSEVLELAADSIRGAFGCHLVFVTLRKNRSGEFYLAQKSAASTLKITENDFAVTDNSLLGRTVNSGRTLYCADIIDDTDYFPGARGLRSVVCVPLMSSEKVIGVLGLGSVSPNNFSTEDINTIETISDILAGAIDKSSLFKETTEKAERLSLIDKINTAISTALDLDSFFNVVAKAVTDNAGYRWTLLVVPDGDSFICKAGYSPQSLGDIYPAPVLELLRNKFERVFSTIAPEFVSFAELASMGKPESLQPIVDAGIRHLALLPIGESEKCEAVLTVGSSRKDGFSVQELSLLHDIAIHLQIAWQNARLYEQLKSAYRRMQEAQDKIIQTEKLRALGEMSSGVVHDFNNILAAILGRVELMIRKMNSIDDKVWLEFYKTNLSVIETAVKDGSIILSRISQFTKKKPTEKFVSIRINEILTDVIELTKPRWYNQALMAGKEVNLKFDCPDNLLVQGSPSELREVFTNLINNAVDAIEMEGMIAITASNADDGNVLVTVEDSGYGMTEETRKKIFEPFFTTKGKSGTGLGLSVTYGIINRHNGHIEVESQVGFGTKFKITLPASGVVEVVEENIEIAESEYVRGSILVVDDEESLREILLEILESIGHTVDIASGGNEAVEMLSNKTYDLVITDLGMDDISGWDLSDIIYSNYPRTKVMLATGWGAQVEPGSLIMHHVNSMINKPFKILDISKVVNEVLTRSRDEVLVDEV